ncbi:MAG TPA: ATP-dependent RecD-like DNA helicase [Limnochordales bacterium]
MNLRQTDNPEPAGAAQSLEVLRAVVRRVTYHEPSTRYTVLRLELDGPAGSPATAVGRLEEPPRAGEMVQLVGRWQVHPTYGRQFQVEALQPLLPSTRQGIERFLASGAIKGVGPVTARRIVEAFGDRALEVLAEQPEEVARRVAGLSLAKAQAIARQLADKREKGAVLAWLQGLGLGPALARRLLQRYGLSVGQVVRSDPYRLALEVGGIGFRRADELARQFGFGPDEPRRFEAALWHVLHEAVEEGHLFLPRPELFARARGLLQQPGGSSGALWEAALQALVRGQRVVLDGESVYPASLFRCETDLARRLVQLARRRMAQPWLPEQLEAELSAAERQLGVCLEAEQREAVRRALQGSMLVITGGPGTGKTTLIRFVVYLARRAGWRVALAAPTGRAAQRLNEAVGASPEGSAGAAGARTIHRLLEARVRARGQEGFAGGEGGDGGPAGLEFARNERHPLEVDLLIVDEASMLDAVLAWNLVRALGPTTRLVLVGDANQLPSVGPGQVLKDVMAGGLCPVVRLSRIFRQAARSEIVVAAHQLLAGRIPQAALRARRDDGRGSDGQPGQGQLWFVPEENPDQVARRVEELVSRELPARFGFDPRRDIQVLAATHRGPAGCDALNQRLQQALNPAGPGRPEWVVGARRLRVGDRVMQVRNDYQARLHRPQGHQAAAKEAGEEVGVFNGETGWVVETRPQDGWLRVRFEDGREVDYDEERVRHLELAYAVTVHKSQGNEYPCVVMPVVWTMPALMTRHLLYTAITRARKLVVLVGQRRALAAYARNATVALRHTSLARRLLEGAREFVGTPR